MDDLWRLNMGSWIIQDGNYGDFATGESHEFAVEFWPESVELACEAQLGAAWVEDSLYGIEARVIVCDPDVWVLDFGLLAFHEGKPPAGLAVGDSVEGKIGLGIDPFFYFERLHAFPQMPPMIYSWTVERILIQTAPFVEGNHPGMGKVLIRDETKLGYRDILRTDAWHDDQGNADYFLECHRLAVPPKKTRAR